jgi:hypothetical protein
MKDFKVSKLSDDDLLTEYMHLMLKPEDFTFGRAAHLETEMKKRMRRDARNKK